MAGKTVSFNTNCSLCSVHLEAIAKWLSCNGEAWGVGPTLVFASAAAMFLCHELGAALLVVGDQAPPTAMEKTLVTSMVLGMLALMIHLWVCSMRFFQYYLDSVIRDSPNMLLELTTAGLLGNQSELVPLGTLTRFLRLQQPQIHITCCWFLALCYADYVRKNYCQRFNMPYLEQWQEELHTRASRGLDSTMSRVNSLVGAVHRRLRVQSTAPPTPQSRTHGVSHQEHTEGSRGSGVSLAGRASSLVSRLSRVSTVATATATHLSSARPLQADLGLRLLSPASETTVDAIEKLRDYIRETRCSCSVSDSDPEIVIDEDISGGSPAVG